MRVNFHGHDFTHGRTTSVRTMIHFLTFIDNQTEYRYVIVNITYITYNTLDYNLHDSDYS